MTYTQYCSWSRSAATTNQPAYQITVALNAAIDISWWRWRSGASFADATRAELRNTMTLYARNRNVTPAVRKAISLSEQMLIDLNEMKDGA